MSLPVFKQIGMLIWMIVSFSHLTILFDKLFDEHLFSLTYKPVHGSSFLSLRILLPNI